MLTTKYIMNKLFKRSVVYCSSYLFIQHHSSRELHVHMYDSLSMKKLRMQVIKSHEGYKIPMARFKIDLGK